VKFSSPDEASAFDEMIAGVARMPVRRRNPAGTGDG